MFRRPLSYHRSPTADHMPVILGFSSAPWASHGFPAPGTLHFLSPLPGIVCPDLHLAAPLSFRPQLKCFPHREAFPEPSPQSAKTLPTWPHLSLPISFLGLYCHYCLFLWHLSISLLEIFFLKICQSFFIVHLPHQRVKHCGIEVSVWFVSLSLMLRALLGTCMCAIKEVFVN